VQELEEQYPLGKIDYEWTRGFESLSSFVENKKRLPLNAEIYNRYAVGQWWSIQKQIFLSKVRGSEVDEERAQLLEPYLELHLKRTYVANRIAKQQANGQDSNNVVAQR
jgi:hypothetical protein